MSVECGLQHKFVVWIDVNCGRNRLGHMHGLCQVGKIALTIPTTASKVDPVPNASQLFRPSQNRFVFESKRNRNQRSSRCPPRTISSKHAGRPHRTAQSCHKHRGVQHNSHGPIISWAISKQSNTRHLFDHSPELSRPGLIHLARLRLQIFIEGNLEVEQLVPVRIAQFVQVELGAAQGVIEV